jgi:hypothetical protein
MGHGSFANDRPDLVGRADPCLIDQILGSPAYVPVRPPVLQVVQVFPNPFRDRTRIVCNLPQATTLRVTIHDASGRQVEEFAPARSSKHEISWSGTDREGRELPPGIYFIRLDLGDATLSKKVLLLR